MMMMISLIQVAYVQVTHAAVYAVFRCARLAR